MKNKIGVAMTTRNRKEVFSIVVEAWRYYTEKAGGLFVVVDDNSIPAYCEADYTFSVRAGIPRAKNKCIELLYDAGCTHFFLIDDDVFPKSPRFWEPYVIGSKIYNAHHFSYCFKEGYTGTLERAEPKIINGLRVWDMANGCFLFYTREAIEKVGGFNTAYGFGCFEHMELSNRICNAGLIPYPYIDIPYSEELVASLDKTNTIIRTMTQEERTKQIVSGYQIFQEKSKTAEYINFRE